MQSESGAQPRPTGKVAGLEGPPLAALHPALLQRFGDLNLGLRDAAPGRCSLSDLLVRPGACLDAFLDMEAEAHPGMDRKAGTAFFLSHLALALLHPVAAMASLHGVVPLLHGDGVALRAEFHDWQHAGRSGRAVRLHLLVDPGCRTTAPEGEEALRLAIHDLAVALLSPVIPALHRASGLSAGALWRIVADMACLAFLRVGEVLGEDEAQRGRAIGVTRRPGSPLNNGRSGFLHVALHAPGTARLIAERWFLQRGGCCRYYTFSDGQKCPTCVLRPEAEQRAILAEHLAALHAPG